MEMKMHTDEVGEFAIAMCIVQKNMKNVVKNKVNPYHKNKYADLTACYEACLSALNENNIAVLQPVSFNSENEVFLTTALLHKSGQWMKSFCPLINVKKDSQGLGSAITYARRYSLCSLVGLCADEDDDGNAASPNSCPDINKKDSKGKQNDVAQKLSKEQFGLLSKKLEIIPAYKAKVKAWLQTQGIHDLMDIPVTMFDGIMKAADKELIEQAKEKSA